jgi:hypothetical protein
MTLILECIEHPTKKWNERKENCTGTERTSEELHHNESKSGDSTGMMSSAKMPIR